MSPRRKTKNGEQFTIDHRRVHIRRRGGSWQADFGQGRQQPLDDPAPVRLVLDADRRGERVLQPGRLEVVRVEGLVADDGVGPAPEGPHQGGRHGAGAAPHEEARSTPIGLDHDSRKEGVSLE